jgi:hypothetical protein
MNLRLRPSLAVFAWTAALPAAAGVDVPVQEQDGVVVLEAESAAAVPDWKLEKDLPGFTGSGFHTWRGPNLWGEPGKGVLTYVFRIVTPGVYHLRLRNRHEHPDASMENDCWTKLDDGAWAKTFSYQRGQWTWVTSFDFGASKPPASYDLKAGVHTLQISGRSANFRIDRIHLYRDGVKNGEDETRPPSPTSFEAMAGPGPYKKLASLAEQVRAGRNLGGALKTLRAKRESADAAEAAEAETMFERLGGTALRQLNAALAMKAGAPVEAVGMLEELAKQFSGDEIGTKAKTEAEALRKDPKVAAELRAEALWEQVERVRKGLKPAGGGRDPKNEAFRRENAAAIQSMLGGCVTLTRRYPDTAAAKRAQAVIEAYR